MEFSHRCDPVFQKSVWIQQLVAHIVGTHLMPQFFLVVVDCLLEFCGFSFRSLEANT